MERLKQVHTFKVVKQVTRTRKGAQRWLIQCIHCGHERRVAEHRLTKSNQPKCGCQPDADHGPARSIFEAIRQGGNELPEFTPRAVDEPTTAPVGSLQKLNVMRARLERGEEVFHPSDQPLAYAGVETKVAELRRLAVEQGAGEDLDRRALHIAAKQLIEYEEG